MTPKSDEKFKEKLKSLKKNWLVVSNMTEGIWWIFTKSLKSLKLSLRWALFVQSIKVWGKTIQSRDGTEQWCKIWINLGLVVSKLAWGIGWTFIKALKNLKICTLMGSFVQSVMFQLEISEELCVMTLKGDAFHCLSEVIQIPHIYDFWN